MNALRLLAVAALLLLIRGTTVAAAARDPLVHVVIHVMLAKPQALAGAGAHWYCRPGRPHTVVPTPEALLRSYEHELRSDGIVTDHFGFGTWTVGSTPSAGTAFMEGDHIDVLTHLSTARRFLAQARTRILVTLPTARADYSTLVRVHRIFDDAGRGGATQIADEGGVHIYTGAGAAARPRIEARLRALGFGYTEEPETFVTDDAPPCAPKR